MNAVTSVVYIIRVECVIELQFLARSATLTLTGKNFHKISKVEVSLSKLFCQIAHDFSKTLERLMTACGCYRDLLKLCLDSSSKLTGL